MVLTTAGRPNGLVIGGDADGRFLWPNDLAFGPTKLQIYVTEGQASSVEIHKVPRPGLPLHAPRAGSR